MIKLSDILIFVYQTPHSIYLHILFYVSFTIVGLDLEEHEWSTLNIKKKVKKVER